MTPLPVAQLIETNEQVSGIRLSDAIMRSPTKARRPAAELSPYALQSRSARKAHDSPTRTLVIPTKLVPQPPGRVQVNAT